MDQVLNLVAHQPFQTQSKALLMSQNTAHTSFPSTTALQNEL